MAYGIPEFPSGNMYDSDLRELLSKYRELVSLYEKFVEDLKNLTDRVDQLENHIDDVLAEKLRDVYAEMAKIRQQMLSIENKMAYLENYVNSENAALKQYVDKEIADMIEQVDAQDKALRLYVQNEISQIRIDVNKYLDDNREWTVNYVANQLALLLAMINALNQKIADVKRYSDNQNTALKLHLEKMINDLEQKIVDITVNQVYVVDPASGAVVDIQQALNNMWDNLTYWKLTALEYGKLQLTAEAYDNWYNINMDAVGITAYEYDYLGKWYLQEKGSIVKYVENAMIKITEMCVNCKKDIDLKIANIRNYVMRMLNMYNPLTGEYDTLKKVVEGLYTLLRRMALTAKEYDDLSMTAEYYDNLEITAYRYDWYGLSDYVPGQVKGGITADIYDNLLVDTLGYVFSN